MAKKLTTAEAAALASGDIAVGTGVNITAATNASPAVVTATAHGLTDGDNVLVENVGGNTNVNGVARAVVLSANTFSLKRAGVAINGNAAYTSGGTVKKLTVSRAFDLKPSQLHDMIAKLSTRPSVFKGDGPARANESTLGSILGG